MRMRLEIHQQKNGYSLLKTFQQLLGLKHTLIVYGLEISAIADLLELEFMNWK